MTTIPYLEGPEFDDEDDDLVSLTSIFNEIKSKLKIEKGIFGHWLKPGQVDPQRLYVSRRVQRLISTLQLNTYGKFQRHFARPLIVAIRPNGKLVDVDGQHTAILDLAATEGGDPELLPCLYIEHPEDRSLQDCLEIEAAVFYALNNNRKDPTHVDKMKAGLAFGLPDAVKYNDNLVECGVYIDGYDYLGDEEGCPMTGEYQWRQAINKFGVPIVSKACSKLIELQQNKNWRQPKNQKKIITSIRSDMVIILSTLYKFIKDAKIGGGAKEKLVSINDFIDNKLVEKKRVTWYEGISGSTTGIVGALRIIKEHNDDPNSTSIGDDLLKRYNLVIDADKPSNK